MRRRRHLRPSRSRQAGLPGALRAAAPRPGERRHLHQRWQRDPLPQSRWGTWPIFSPTRCWPTLPGELAIGHTRYSTAGDTVLLNAQPFSVACNKGRVAVAHNGNITNATELRAELERPRLDLPGQQRHRSDSAPGGALFRAHAGGRAARRAAATRRALFRWCFLAEDRIIVARDPHGFRPLAMGEMEVPAATTATSSPRRPAPST